LSQPERVRRYPSRSADTQALLDVLGEHSDDQRWWIGYVQTGVDDLVFSDAARTILYWGWRYVELALRHLEQGGVPFDFPALLGSYQPEVTPLSQLLRAAPGEAGELAGLF